MAQGYVLPKLDAIATQSSISKSKTQANQALEPTRKFGEGTQDKKEEQTKTAKSDKTIKKMPRLATEGYVRTQINYKPAKSNPVNISPIEHVEEFIKETEEPKGQTKSEKVRTPKTIIEDSVHIIRPAQDDSSIGLGDTDIVINVPQDDSSLNIGEGNQETPNQNLEEVNQTDTVQDEVTPELEVDLVTNDKNSEEEPIIEESINEEPVIEESINEEPVIEESINEEPVIEESIIEEPVISETETGYTEMRVQATMYSQHQVGLSNWTAGGYNLNENPNIIAVNPNVIPYGSIVDIEGVGVYIAGDTGSYVTWGGDYTTGIDIHTNDLNEAYQFGKKFVNIKVYPEGTVLGQTTGPVISEPVIEEPVISEPVIEESVISEPVIEEPVISEPVIAEPVIEEPVISESEYETELEVSEDEQAWEVVEEEPVIEEPVYEEPEYEEPVYEEPVYVEPEYEEPVYEEPVIEEPTDTYGNYAGDLISTANKYVGTPYVWGGKSPSGFDCSGFVYYVFMEAYGINVGGWTGDQQYAGQLISVEEAQAGDLYFWGTYGGNTTHVAIATGGGSYIHASQPGTPLGYGSIGSFTPDFAIRL